MFASPRSIDRLTSLKSMRPSLFVSHAAMRARTSTSHVVGLAWSARYAITSSGERVAVTSSDEDTQSVCGTSPLHLFGRKAAAAVLVHRAKRGAQRGVARGARVALLEAPIGDWRDGVAHQERYRR